MFTLNCYCYLFDLRKVPITEYHLFRSFSVLFSVLVCRQFYLGVRLVSVSIVAMFQVRFLRRPIWLTRFPSLSQRSLAALGSSDPLALFLGRFIAETRVMLPVVASQQSTTVGETLCRCRCYHPCSS